MSTLADLRAVERGWLTPIRRLIAARELKQLPHILWPSERVVCMIVGWYELGAALLVATDKRLILIDQKPFDLKVDGFSYSRIEAVEFDRALFAGRVTVTMPGSKINMRWVNPLAVRNFTKYVSNCVAHTHPVIRDNIAAEPNEEPKLESADSQLSMLERLSKLYSEGSLSAREFQEQKDRLFSQGNHLASKTPTVTRIAEKINDTFMDYPLPDNNYN